MAVLKKLCVSSESEHARLGIRGASGLGLVVYALTVSNLFSNELIAADRSLDLIAGSAGGILGLLALYRKTQSKEVLAKAIACGEHLLRQARLCEAGKRSWVVLGVSESPLTGFSHGAAGFAYALSSLAKVSGREEFEVAAQECVAYEDSCYNKDVFNWPDLRSTDATVFPSQWCHGAVGIGLARVASGRAGKAKVETIVSGINHAVQNTTANWPQHVDTLCCGDLL